MPCCWESSNSSTSSLKCSCQMRLGAIKQTFILLPLHCTVIHIRVRNVHECVHFGNCANTAPSGNDRQIVHSATPWPGCACLAYLHLHQIISFPTPRRSASGSRMRRKQPMCSTLNPAALGLSTQLWWSKSTLLYLSVHVQMDNIVIIWEICTSSLRNSWCFIFKMLLYFAHRAQCVSDHII